MNRVTRKFIFRQNVPLACKSNRDATIEFEQMSIDSDLDLLKDLGYTRTGQITYIFEQAYKLSKNQWLDVIEKLGFERRKYELEYYHIDFCTADRSFVERLIRKEFFPQHGGVVLGLLFTDAVKNPKRAEQNLRLGRPIYTICLTSCSPCILAHELAHVWHWNHSEMHAELTKKLTKEIIKIIAPKLA